MNLRNIDLNLLVIFEALFIERSTTLAAKKLAMTQSAVSKSLSRMRDTFDDPLFTRDQSGLTPTRYSEDIFPAIQSSLDQIRGKLLPSDRFDYQDASVTYRIACCDFFNHAPMHRLIDWLGITAKQIRLTITNVTNQVDHPLAPANRQVLNHALKDGMIDLVIHHEENFGDSLRAQLLMEDEWIAVGGEDYPGTSDQEVPESFFADATGYVSLGFTNIDQILKENDLVGEPAVTVDNIQQALIIVQNSDYVTVLPRKAVSSYQEKLKYLPLRGILPSYRLYQYWHENSHEHAPTRWLRRLISSNCKRL